MKPRKATKKTARKRPAKKAAKKVAAKKKKGGRPTAFKTEYCELARNYCLLGAINEDLARFFGVAGSTIDKWIVDHPEFSGSLKEGREMADMRVSQALYSRAVGYSMTDTKFATHEGRITDAREYIKNFAPDVTACIFWLKNRRPDLWRDKQEVETTAKTELVISEDAQDKMMEAMKHAVEVRPPASFNGEVGE